MSRAWLLGVGILLGAVACSKQHPGAGGRGLAILAHVPADTPYVIAALEPWSREYFEHYLAQQRGRMSGAVDKLRASAGDSEGLRFLVALLDEAHGLQSVADLERMGLNPFARTVLYGLGFLPALRVEVADTAKLQATIERAARTAGATLPRRTQRGRPYYAIPATPSWTVLIALEHGELLASIAPAKLAERILDLLRGDVAAGPGISVATLEKLAADNGFQKQFVGIIDLRRLAALAVEEQGLARDTLAAVGAPRLPASCKDELAAFAALSPRWTMGITEMTPHRSAGTFTLELAPLLSRELVELRVPVPGVGARIGDGVLSMGAALDVGKLIALLRRGAGVVNLVPYKCPVLGAVNQVAAELSRELGRPLPPWIAELRGFAATVQSVEPGAAIPSVKAYGLLAASDPIQLIDMAKRAVPQLAGLEIPPDGRPVPMPGGLLPLMTGHVAMKGQILGLSIGAGSELHLLKLMSSRPEGDMPIFHLAFDAARLREVMKALGPLLGGDDSSLGDGAFHMTMELTERGVVFRGEEVSTSPTP